MAQPPKKRGPKPKNPVPDDYDDDLIGVVADAPPEESVSIALADVYGGVSASWLAQVFGHDKNTIAKKLATAGIEVVGRRNNGPLYRIPDAAAYLVKPKVDLVAYVKTLRPNDLPPMLNVAYWDAMLKRQKWEENAGDLWRTEDVLTVFGDLAFEIKTTVNLWVEEVDRREGLTNDQRKIITELSDTLLVRVHQQMVEAPGQRKTSSSATEDGAMPEQATESTREV